MPSKKNKRTLMRKGRSRLRQGGAPKKKSRKPKNIFNEIIKKVSKSAKSGVFYDNTLSQEEKDAIPNLLNKTLIQIEENKDVYDNTLLLLKLMLTILVYIDEFFDNNRGWISRCIRHLNREVKRRQIISKM